MHHDRRGRQVFVAFEPAEEDSSCSLPSDIVLAHTQSISFKYVIEFKAVVAHDWQQVLIEFEESHEVMKSEIQRYNIAVLTSIARTAEKPLLTCATLTM